MANILIVDDEEFIRKLLQRIFKMTSHNIDEAIDGMDALEKVKKKEYELMLVDLKMPKMDGEELIQTIRKTNEKISFVVLTGHGDLKMAIHFLQEYQISDFLLKPPQTPHQLLFAVESALEKQQLRIERELLLAEKYNRELQDKINNFKNLVFTILSHRIRTPANYILGPASLLSNQINKKVTVKNIDQWKKNSVDLLTSLQKGIEILMHLSDKLYFYCELTSKNLKINIQQEKLSNMLDLSIVELVNKMDAKNIKHTIIVPENFTGVVLCDIKLVKYSIKELLENAIKYSPNNGTITITVAEFAKEISISIQDEGPGIPVKKQEKIFDTFALTETQQNLEDTLSMSLCIIKQIMHLHEAKVTVESTPNNGAKFTLSFLRNDCQF